LIHLQKCRASPQQRLKVLRLHGQRPGAVLICDQQDGRH
jgi:hypothetical protein